MDITENKKTSLKDNEIKALMRFKKILLERYSLVDIKLFGSKARGLDTPDSDIDILIEIEELSPEIETEIGHIAFEINLEYNCFISTIIFSRKELEEGPLSESPLYKNVQYEGVKI